MNAGIAVIARQNRILRTFEDRGAVSLDRGRTLSDLGIRDSFVFRRLVSAGAIREHDDGTFYLDREAAEAFRGQRRTRMLVAIGAAVIAVLIGWALN